MLKTFKELTRNQSGSVIILVTLALVALVASMALVIDVGLVFAQRIKASNAVDAAVLAGVRELPADPAEAIEIAQNYAQMNGLKPGEISFGISEDQRSLSGWVAKEQPMHFARLLGINAGQVQAHATARLGPIGSLPPNAGGVPLGVSQQELVFGETVTLKEGGGSGTEGWYGCLDFLSLTGGNGGAADYRRYLSYGYDGSGYIGYGTLVLEEPGVMSGPTSTGVNYRISKCINECDRECTAEDHDPDCPRVVIAMVGELYDKKFFQVHSFAGFFLEDVTGQGNDSIIRGQYIGCYVPGAEIDETITDNGVYTMELSE